MKFWAALFIAAASIGANWEYSETVDAMSDKKYARAFAGTPAEEGRFGLKCDAPGPSSLYLHFISKEYLGGGGGRGAFRRLMVRIDKDDPVETEWFYDGRSAILSSANPAKERMVWAIVDRLRTGSSISIRAWDYEFAQHDASIAIAGGGSSFDKVIASCGAIRPAGA